MNSRRASDVLLLGPTVWNEWRATGADLRLDLAHLDLSTLDLRGANLADCKLAGSSLSGANLAGANLRNADLSGAFLVEADLRGACLKGARLRYADLSGARLSFADLTEADLSCSYLGNADLSQASLGQTSLGATVLTGVVGLSSCHHAGFSVVDHRTMTSLVRDGGDYVQFLRGCGVPVEIIDYLPSLLIKPIRLHSCFISYSHADAAFARRLYDRLTARGVSCWLDEHRMIAGESMFELIERGISLWDKVLLCCSRAALEKSWWVDREIETALLKEERLWQEYGRKTVALVPLNLDGFVYDWGGPKASHLRSRYILDFSGWNSSARSFNATLDRLLVALRPESPVVPGPGDDGGGLSGA